MTRTLESSTTAVQWTLLLVLVVVAVMVVVVVVVDLINSSFKVL